MDGVGVDDGGLLGDEGGEGAVVVVGDGDSDGDRFGGDWGDTRAGELGVFGDEVVVSAGVVVGEGEGGGAVEFVNGLGAVGGVVGAL